MVMKEDILHAVLHEGLLVTKGMPNFDDLSEQETQQIYMFIRWRAHKDVSED